MRLHRFQLVPESAWRTPWQSDTLAGMLCGAIARLEGSAVLRQQVLAPALARQPPFVLSDAFPGDWLPLPALARLFDWPEDQRKSVKRARWITRPAFRSLQHGDGITPGDLHTDSACFLETAHLHNTIARDRNTTQNDGGLFAREETYLARNVPCLTIYVCLADDFRTLFWRAIHELATGGFGADRSAGKGQFRIHGSLAPDDELDQLDESTGAIVLSTFQPGPADPIDGAWDAFTKFGKLGPEFGLDNIFKRPLVLLRPGAAFRMAAPRPWLGRALAMNEILAADAVAALRAQDVEVAHLAFGLALPLRWQTDQPIRTQPAIAAAPPWPPKVPVTPKPTQSGGSMPHADEPVLVTLLERIEKVGPIAFRVQQPGQPKGMLNHGTPPDPIPALGTAVAVYREPASQPNNPSYRWSPPVRSFRRPGSTSPRR